MDFDETSLRVLLDITVVQNFLTFGEYIQENYLSEDLAAKLNALPQAIQNDIHALRSIFGPATRTPVVPIVSVLTLHELAGTGDEEKRRALLNWGFDLLEYSIDVGEFDPSATLSPNQTLFPDFLPGKIDRLLIGECKKAKCQAFITMDYKTVLKYRTEIAREDHVTVLSPSEWWIILEPWFSLWV